MLRSGRTHTKMVVSQRIRGFIEAIGFPGRKRSIGIILRNPLLKNTRRRYNIFCNHGRIGSGSVVSLFLCKSAGAIEKAIAFCQVISELGSTTKQKRGGYHSDRNR